MIITENLSFEPGMHAKSMYDEGWGLLLLMRTVELKLWVSAQPSQTGMMGENQVLPGKGSRFIGGRASPLHIFCIYLGGMINYVPRDGNDSNNISEFFIRLDQIIYDYDRLAFENLILYISLLDRND